jgi:hypothetical protein
MLLETGAKITSDRFSALQVACLTAATARRQPYQPHHVRPDSRPLPHDSARNVYALSIMIVCIVTVKKYTYVGYFVLV